MTNLTPAANVQAAAVAGLLITVLEDVLSRHGVTLSPDIANGLTAFAAILVAHLWDMLTGGNVAPEKESKDAFKNMALYSNPVSNPVAGAGDKPVVPLQPPAAGK